MRSIRPTARPSRTPSSRSPSRRAPSASGEGRPGRGRDEARPRRHRAGATTPESASGSCAARSRTELGRRRVRSCASSSSARPPRPSASRRARARTRSRAAAAGEGGVPLEGAALHREGPPRVARRAGPELGVTARRSCGRSRSRPAISTPPSSRAGSRREPFPFGHECVAEVTDVGDAVESRRAGRPGQRPVPDLVRRVRHLPAGHTGNCESVPRLSMYGLPIGDRLRRLR